MLPRAAPPGVGEALFPPAKEEARVVRRSHLAPLANPIDKRVSPRKTDEQLLLFEVGARLCFSHQFRRRAEECHLVGKPGFALAAERVNESREVAHFFAERSTLLVALVEINTLRT